MTQLEEINLPDSLESIGAYAFYGSGITSVTLKNAATVGSYAFSNCVSLGTAALGNVSSIGENAFENCTALGSVDIPDTVIWER